ncbi:MAG: RNA 2',3'-cyclic phosphodiesterase [Terracidiphilus sp.]
MRLFVGIAPAGAVARELKNVVARLRSGDCGLRWSEPDSWHITLQFLGNATPVQYDCLMEQLGKVRSAPVPVELGALGCFDHAGALIVHVAATPGLTALAERVMAATSQCGFATETRPYHPHITLARAKGKGRDAELRALASRMRSQRAFTRFVAREFLLYESHLGAEGARYAVRGRFPLNGP